jgi:hypothetical protein
MSLWVPFFTGNPVAKLLEPKTWLIRVPRLRDNVWGSRVTTERFPS